jgi:hypothetical protein
MSTTALPATPVVEKLKGNASVFIVSVIFHAALAVIAGIWIVSRYIQAPAAKFEAPPKAMVKIPPQTRQHRMNLAARDGMAPKPTFNRRIMSLRPMPFALPEAPKVNLDQMLMADPSAIANVSAQLGGLGGAGNGQGDGFGGQGGLAGKINVGKGFRFLGINTKGERILLMFDVSDSVLHKAADGGVPLSKIKEETLQMITTLPINARFNIVQFVRNYKPFQQELIPATPANRELAKQWMESEWNESGSLPRGGRGVVDPTPNGLPPVLDFAFSNKPDAIFLISDGSFERGRNGENDKITGAEFDAKIKGLEAAAGKKVPIYFIGFGMKPGDKADWEKIVPRTGGRLREMAKGKRK